MPTILRKRAQTGLRDASVVAQKPLFFLSEKDKRIKLLER